MTARRALLRRTITRVALCVLCCAPSGLSAQEQALNTGFRGAPADAPRIDVVMTRGLTHSRQLPPHLIRARKAMFRGAELRSSTLRALADYHDGNAAMKLASRIDLDAHSERAADAAHYYGIAAATGRGGAIYGLVRALDRTDPETTSPARLDVLRNVLIAYAKAGSRPAIEAVLRYHSRGVPFGHIDADLSAIASANNSAGAPHIALQLASDLLNDGAGTAAELEQARDYLAVAQSSDSLRLKVVAGNMLPLVEARLAALPPAPAETSPDTAPEEESLQ